MIMHLLDGLGIEYNHHVSTLNIQVDDLSIEEVKSKLISFEGIRGHSKTRMVISIQAEIVTNDLMSMAMITMVMETI